MFVKSKVPGNPHIFEMQLASNPRGVVVNNPTLECLGTHHLVSQKGHLTMLTDDGKSYDVLPDLTLVEK